MEDKIRVGIINYLNTRPLLYGLEKTPIRQKIELIEDVPAKLAEMLMQGKIDIGLVPVAIIPKLPQYFINGHYCIGAVGDVASVCLLSQVPLSQIETIILDYQSTASAALCKWLITHHWKLSPKVINAQDESYINDIKGSTAGLIIGDRALQQRHHFSYIYDLAGEWKAATGLPFVFAAWVSTHKLSDDFIKIFDDANAYGLHRLDEVIAQIPEGIYNLKKYYSKDLSYNLDAEKRKGLDKFLKILIESNF